MQSLRLRSQLVTACFCALVLVSLVAALSDYSLVLFLQGVTPGVPADQAYAQELDDRQALIGIGQLVTGLACAVVFLMWFQRAYKNLHAAGYQELRFKPGWAIGGFFVPFLNLARPFQIMKEICSGSSFLAHDARQHAWKSISLGVHAAWWWALFLSDSAFGNASGRMMQKAEGIDKIITAEWVDFASSLYTIPAAIVTLLLVRRLTELQELARLRRQDFSS